MIYKEAEIYNIPDLHYKAISHVFEEGLVSDSGLWLEFGVYVGNTIKRIARMTTRKCIFGFDSFEGIPENWDYRFDGTYPKGSFSLKGQMPKVPDNVTLVKGWFQDTLPDFVTIHGAEPITFLHIDSDIYSSSKEIFTHLAPQISNGCIIVFDELVGYEGFEHHEWKAWWEFVEQHDIMFEWIGGNRSHIAHPRNPKIHFEYDYPDPISVSPLWENVAVKIINNPSFREGLK